jgi:inner membrane protein
MAKFQSITFKVLGIGALALLMLIPLSQVNRLIEERTSLRDQALQSIADGWGGTQMAGNPVLAIPRTVRVAEKTGWVQAQDANGNATVQPAQSWSAKEDTEFRLPEQADIGAKLDVEMRHYNIYEAPVYTAHLHLKTHFDAVDLKDLLANEGGYHGDRAELRLPLSDLRGLREVVTARVNGVDRRFVPSYPVSGIPTVAVPLQREDLGRDIDFEVELQLAGTQRLQFLPLARTTTVDASAPWGDPSFIGATLPAKREVAAKAFTAHWQVLDLNRGFGQVWRESEMASISDRMERVAFGVSLFQPANLYLQNTRAGKYGLLFIALTFIAFFLFEVLKRLRVHPMQYLLVGLALSTFYVVLLAFSEQVGFAPAYGLAATAVVLMVGGYAAAVLATRQAGFLLGGVLALVYALLYGLVVSEEYSLMIGAVALLAVVALLMFLTRKIDWYSYARSPA